MVTRILKKIVPLLLTTLLLFNLTGCQSTDDGLNVVFRYDISANPQTLDPQIADEPNSEIIISNLYMGLLKEDLDGSIIPGVASDYLVSDDGLTYDFKLRQDIFWIDGDEFERMCTADDFVFSFQRLFNPQTKSPHAKDYFCIANSSLINSGKLNDYSLLGVKKTGDFELRITLEYPNSRFLSLLTEPAAMPCNEEFFLKSQGKYGLSDDCTPSNGAFYLKSWTYDPYAITDINNLVLGRNYKNTEAYQICPAGLNFFIEDKEKFINDFLSGEVTCVAVANDEKNLISGDFGCQEYNNITCGLVFNREFPLFENEEFCRALSLLVDRETIMASIPDFTAADGIVPQQVRLSGECYRENTGKCDLGDFDEIKAREIFDEVSQELDSTLFSGARIIVSNTAAQTAVSYLMQEWQKEFGFYCVVETLDEEEYMSRLKSGDYEIAIAELTGSYDSPGAYLEQFCKNNPGNYSNFYNSDFERIINDAENASDVDEAMNLYHKGEQLLIDKSAFVPLYCKSVYFFTAEGCEDLVYNPFSKSIDFTNAKMFD